MQRDELGGISSPGFLCPSPTTGLYGAIWESGSPVWLERSAISSAPRRHSRMGFASVSLDT